MFDKEKPFEREERTDLNKTAKAVLQYVLAFLKWFLGGAVLGAICGGVGALFHKSIDFVTDFRMEHSFLVWFLPLAGVVTLLCYRLCKLSFQAGTNLIIESVSTNEHVPILLAPLIFLGTVLSHLFGASVGREGAALQLGGSIGHNFGELFRFRREDVQVFSMCGMAACFSALFGTPVTAAVFVLEVIRVGAMRYNAFLPCMVSSFSAFLTASALGVSTLTFQIPRGVLPFAPINIGKTILLAALCAVVSILFCTLIHKASHLAEKYLKNPYLRIAVGGLVMAVLTVAFGLYDYNGAGTGIIERAVGGSVRPEAFLLKLLLTALCVGVGFRGGEIVPTMFIGAAFGCFMGPLLGLDAGFSAAVGLVSLFCSVVNCPIASLFLAMEVFGTTELPLFAVAIAVSFVLSGYFGLYSSQKIVFSKVKQEVIEKNAQ